MFWHDSNFARILRHCHVFENKKCKNKRNVIIPTLIQHASACKPNRLSLNARKKSTYNKIHKTNSNQIRRIKHNTRTGNITKHIKLMLICHSCYNTVVIIVTFLRKCIKFELKNTKSNLFNDTIPNCLQITCTSPERIG